MSLPEPPAGAEGIARFCGDIAPYIRRDGTISRSWEAEKIGFAHVPAPMVLSWDPSVEIRRIRVHRRAVLVYEAAFRAVHDAGLWSFLRVFGGAYNFRVIRGAGRLSTHAFGLATDHDPVANPLGEPAERCAMAAAVVEIMTGFGSCGVATSRDGRTACTSSSRPGIEGENCSPDRPPGR
jgi:hypothetical protein